jgi:hypothetical protein
MDRSAIFVDAGYFFAAGASAAFGQPNIPRKQFALKSPGAMISELSSRAANVAGNLPLLRIYWYDAIPGPRLSLEQTNLAKLSGVKLRLGALNSLGEQKGVDSLIVTDLIDLARNKAIAEAVIISGDEDLRIAVQIAQSFGVRVHILAAGDASKNVSPELQMEADSAEALDSDWFRRHLELVAISKPIATPGRIEPAPAIDDPQIQSSNTEEIAIGIVQSLVANLTSEQKGQLFEHFNQNRTVPPEYDRPLIAQVSTALSNRRLSGTEMRAIRGIFVTTIRNVVSAAATSTNPSTKEQK